MEIFALIVVQEWKVNRMNKEVIIDIENPKDSDLISRQAAIDALTKTSGIRGDALKALYDLPPVTPQQKTGYWIPQGNYDEWGNENSYKCSECGDVDSYPDNYCHNCGTKMQGVEE